MSKYTYDINSDFKNNKVNIRLLESEISISDITIAVKGISTARGSCVVEFKSNLSASEDTTLSGIISNHTGDPIFPSTVPTSVDGRPIVRSDSRPQGYYTYFTMRGDTVSGIGDGNSLFFDFSNDDDLIASGTQGYYENCATKRMQLAFIDPVYVKEGTVYFFEAPKGSHFHFGIVCPAGAYYLKNDGSPAYAFEDTEVVNYVNYHYFSGSCPMGDELNTEGCNENPIPSGYKLRFDVCVPTTVSGWENCYGYGEVEMYRPRTVVIA